MGTSLTHWLPGCVQSPKIYQRAEGETCLSLTLRQKYPQQGRGSPSLPTTGNVENFLNESPYQINLVSIVNNTAWYNANLLREQNLNVLTHMRVRAHTVIDL